MGQGRGSEMPGEVPGGAPAGSPVARAREGRPGAGADLSRLAGWRPFVAATAGAVLSGLLLSASFPPLEWDWLAWVGLAPVCLAPMLPGRWARVATGYGFGLAFWAANLLWLNEVGFCAGILLAFYCALFPALWYVLLTGLAASLGAAPRGLSARCPGDVPSGWRQAAFIAGGAVLWVGLEWVRGGLFTGFPWNELGISQWRRPFLVSLTCFTGVAGISLLLAAANLTVVCCWCAWRRAGLSRRAWVVPLSTLGAALAAAWAASGNAPSAGTPSGVFRVLVVQGNIPQCRDWTEEEFREALRVYTELTCALAPALQPELVVWPESAVPAPVGYEPFSRRLAETLSRIQTRMLIGALDSRPAPDTGGRVTPREPETQDFNSAILLAPEGRVLESYDKIHRVPFGEYVPFADWLPWLVDWIGMGRGLTPGSEYTLFRLAPGVLAGVNICFEDAFADISRQFVRRGATVLMTLTNDAWYAESAGSRQHLVHAVFRAAENRRPLLRSGNNSDTCLILPDGRITGLLYDERTGNRFVRGARLYEVPVYSNQPLTLHARWGPWFQRLCGVLGAGLATGLLAHTVRQCRRRRAAIEKPSSA